jgi:hypothetical protein
MGANGAKSSHAFGKPADDNPRAVAPETTESSEPKHSARADVSGATNASRERRAPAAEKPAFVGVSRPDQEMRASATLRRQFVLMAMLHESVKLFLRSGWR